MSVNCYLLMVEVLPPICM